MKFNLKKYQKDKEKHKTTQRRHDIMDFDKGFQSSDIKQTVQIIRASREMPFEDWQKQRTKSKSCSEKGALSCLRKMIHRTKDECRVCSYNI